MDRCLIDHRQALLAEDSPLWSMAGQPVRFLFRATSVYLKIMGVLQQPEYLRDGVDRSIGLEILKRSAAGQTETPRLQPGFGAVLERIKELSEADLPVQVRMIEATLYLRGVAGHASAEVDAAIGSDAAWAAPGSSGDVAVDTVIRIVETPGSDS